MPRHVIAGSCEKNVYYLKNKIKTALFPFRVSVHFPQETYGRSCFCAFGNVKIVYFSYSHKYVAIAPSDLNLNFRNG